MKIMIIGYDPQASGIATYSLEMAKLIRTFADVYLVCNRIMPDKLEGIKTVFTHNRRQFSFTPLFNSLLRKSEILEIYEEISPNLVHETLPPMGFGLPRRITTRWGYVGYFRLAWIRSSQMPFPYNLGGFPVTVQHYIGDTLSRRTAETYIDVSVESGHFIPPPMSIGPLKNECGEENLQLLFVSRDLNMKRKNLKVILEALKKARKRFTLHLIGKGRIQGDNIFSHGYMHREEVIEMMKRCDALVLPSLYEEVGYVGLEAYSVGLPVIASNIPSFKTILKKSLFFEPTNIEQLTSILDMIDRDNLTKLGIESRKYLKELNEITKVKLVELFKRTIEY